MKQQILSTFHLKIIAMILMLIDHIGVLFSYHLGAFLTPMRAIGRLALPLFAFLVVEAIRYSKNPIKYFIQLLIMEVIIDLGDIIFYSGYEGCIFITLLMGGLIIYFLEKDKWYLKLIALVPIAISILSMYSFFPIRLQYGVYGVGMILCFYVGYKLAMVFYPLITKSNLPKNQEDPNFASFTFTYTLLASLVFIIYVLTWSALSYQMNIIFEVIDTDYVFQTYAIISSVFILLYNGKKGYNSKVFKYGSYLFYPLHLILIYVIYILVY